MTAPPRGSRSVPITPHYPTGLQDLLEEAPRSPVFLENEKKASKEGPATPPTVLPFPVGVPPLAIVSFKSDSLSLEPLSDSQRSHHSHFQSAAIRDDLLTLSSMVPNTSGKKILAGVPAAPSPSTMHTSLASPKRNFSSKSNRAKLSSDSKESDHPYGLTKHTSPVQNAATFHNEADRIVYREFFDTLKKMIDKLKDRQVSNDKEVAKVNKRIVPRLVQQIGRADRWLSSGTANATKMGAAEPENLDNNFARVTAKDSNKDARSDSILASTSLDNEIADFMQEVEEVMDQVIEQSRKGSITEVSNIIYKLTEKLNRLIDQYKTLQADAPKDIEKRVENLFSKYCFSLFRGYFWELSTKLPVTCHKQKKESLFCLIRCLENDPINTVSQTKLPQLLGQVVDYLDNEFHKSASQKLDVEATTSFLETFTLISEVWAWHNENISKMTVKDGLIGKAQEILDTIAKGCPELAIGEHHYTVCDMRLQCDIATAALHNLTTDRNKLKIIFGIVAPAINAAKHFASSGDIVSAVQTAFKTLHNAFDQNKAKITHSEWYVNLFAMRKIVCRMTSELDKIKFLQASLKLPASDGLTWRFIASVIRLLGRWGLETEDQQLRNIICAGQKTTKSPLEELPGLIHLCDRKTYANYSAPHKTYLTQLAKTYWIAIASLLGAEEEQKLKAWFLAADGVMPH